jgi:2-hydroxychromene-2-carboxylate isomerase
MADVEFFFDPICPWAWLTSRWTCEVAERRGLDVDWRFICLRMVNENMTYESPGYLNAHSGGHKMLRVAAAGREAAGNDAVAHLYTEFGLRVHNAGRGRSEVREGNLALIEEAVSAVGLDPTIAAAADDEVFDAILRKETELALSRTGPDVGTPILTFAPGTEREASFFGPVISRIPRGDEAVDLWDAVEKLARMPGLYELKRTNRQPPDFS